MMDWLVENPEYYMYTSLLYAIIDCTQGLSHLCFPQVFKYWFVLKVN
jgi:hypothetical protein